MYYENTMKVTMKNENAAAAALEIMKTRLTAGFDCDKGYKRNPSMLMHDALEVIDNTIVLPEEFGCYTHEDADKVIPELMQDLAAHLSTEVFTFDVRNSSDYDEGWIEGSYANGKLKVKTTYFPSGYCNLYCQECDKLIATMSEYEDNNTYICPECGEEIDLSDWAPVTTEKTFQII